MRIRIPPRTIAITTILSAIILGFTSLHSPGRDASDALRVLVFSKTLLFRHASITNGIAAIRELGAQHGFAVDATEDSSVFTTTNLARYQAVV